MRVENLPGLDIDFQSYLSPIQTDNLARAGTSTATFNPTLVQFKHFKEHIFRSRHVLFQSYLSPIQTCYILSRCRRFFAFQSYLSPIQTHAPQTVLPRDCSFNPTLVQFKQIILTGFDPTSKTFNPTLVQFKLARRKIYSWLFVLSILP